MSQTTPTRHARPTPERSAPFSCPLCLLCRRSGARPWPRRAKCPLRLAQPAARRACGLPAAIFIVICDAAQRPAAARGLALPERARIRRLLVAVSTLWQRRFSACSSPPALNGLIGVGPERIAVVRVAGIEAVTSARSARLHYYARLDGGAAPLPPGRYFLGRYDEAWGAACNKRAVAADRAGLRSLPDRAARCPHAARSGSRRRRHAMTVRVMPIKYAIAAPRIAVGALHLGCRRTGEAAGQSVRERIRERIEQRRTSPPARESRPPMPKRNHRRLHRSRPAIMRDADPRRPAAPLPDPQPPGLDPARAAPLVLAFHGGAATPNTWPTTRATASWPRPTGRGSSSSFPTATAAFRRQAGHLECRWLLRRRARDKGIDDVGFVRAVVADVQARCASTRRASSPPACPTAP